jgi:hypothetical protein
VGIFFGRGPNLGPPTFIAGFCTLTSLSYLIIGATISSYNYETNSYLYFNWPYLYSYYPIESNASLNI